MRKTLPASLLKPAPSDISNLSSTILRSASALPPGGIITAVSALEYSAGLRQRISRPQPRTARRVASAWRSGRGGAVRRPPPPRTAVPPLWGARGAGGGAWAGEHALWAARRARPDPQHRAAA